MKATETFSVSQKELKRDSAAIKGHKCFLIRGRTEVISRELEISLISVKSLLYSSVRTISRLHYSKCNIISKCNQRLLYLLCCNPWP